MARVCVTSVSFSKNSQLRSELLESFPDVKFNETGRKMTESDVVEFARGFNAIVVGTEPITSTVVDALPEVRVFAKYGVGLDSIDVEYLKSAGRILSFEPGVNRRSVSELALSFMLALVHNVHRTSADLKQGIWTKEGGRLLRGRTVGIIGCGAIGQDLLLLLRPFECRVLVCDIEDRSRIAADFGARQVGFQDVLRESDIVTLHVPLTAATSHMIGAPQFEIMQDHSLLINTSRGSVVDGRALKEALLAGLGRAPGAAIAGAALDVFESEPPTDLSFLALPNLLATPHIGGNALEAVLAMGRSAIQGLKRHLSP
ncbi:MAG: phosphoglycerate dehydrogenase [Leptospirales bacterium]|nr:phosphoglycerate dehydrogenase [Leptospirales bacterium]